MLTNKGMVDKNRNPMLNIEQDRYVAMKLFRMIEERQIAVK